MFYIPQYVYKTQDVRSFFQYKDFYQMDLDTTKWLKVYKVFYHSYVVYTISPKCLMHWCVRYYNYVNIGIHNPRG